MSGGVPHTAAVDAIETLARDLAGRISEAFGDYEIQGAVCSVCLLMSERGDTAWDVDSLVVGREAQRLADIDGLYDEARWHAAWSPELGIEDGYLELADEPSSEAHEASRYLEEAPDEALGGGEYGSFRYVLDMLSRDLTARRVVPEPSPDFVVHPDYDGDYLGWLPVSLRRVAPAGTLASLEAKRLVPPLPT